MCGCITAEVVYDTAILCYHHFRRDTVEKRHFAAVLPNVDDSCFVNMNIGNKYENYVAKELPSIIWNMFK